MINFIIITIIKFDLFLITLILKGNFWEISKDDNYSINIF